MATGRVSLVIQRVGREADGVLSLGLVDPHDRPLPAWSAGAHVDVHLPSGRVRSYSLCGDHADRSVYRIAVLLASDGRGGSAEVHGQAAEGRVLTVGPPRNNFDLRPAVGYLFIAGGIGITPILAMARTASRSGAPWTLLYGGRTRASMAFVPELLALPGGTVHVVPQDERGLPDLDAALRNAPPGSQVYCCGPSPMIDAVLAAGAELRPDLPVHLERFSAGSGHHRDDDAPFQVGLARTGTTLTVAPGTSILEAVRSVLPAVASSCEAGICSACETAVLGGVPDHRDEVLTPAEKAANTYMMICVSRSRSPRLVLDL